MCQFSAVAGRNTRDARQGENLVITRSPHGFSNWLTEPGKKNCAVCIPDTAILAIQRPGSGLVRGARFEQRRTMDENGDHDFLHYEDGMLPDVEALNNLPLGTEARVLRLFSNLGQPSPSSAVAAVRHEEEVPTGA